VTETLINLFGYPVGIVGAAAAVAYFLRINKLSFKECRADYVLLHLALGAGCVASAIDLLFDNYQLTWPRLCIVAAAVCHLMVTHQKGERWRPSDYFSRSGRRAS
jgi:hypothetical protein